jgi:hypothetical protein
VGVRAAAQYTRAAGQPSGCPHMSCGRAAQRFIPLLANETRVFAGKTDKATSNLLLSPHSRQRPLFVVASRESEIPFDIQARLVGGLRPVMMHARRHKIVVHTVRDDVLQTAEGIAIHSNADGVVRAVEDMNVCLR